MAKTETFFGFINDDVCILYINTNCAFFPQGANESEFTTDDEVEEE